MHFLYYLNSYGKTIVLVSVPSPKRHNLQLFPACFPCPQNNCAMPLTHLWLLSIYIPSTFSSCTNSPQLRPLICLLLTCRSPYMHAFFPFLQFFHILSETLPCFGLLLQYCWPCLLFSARPSSLYICWAHLWSCQPTRNVGIISGTITWFLPRQQFLHWFTGQGGLIYLPTCITASSRLYRLLTLDLQLSWMVPLLWVHQSKLIFFCILTLLRKR